MKEHVEARQLPSDLGTIEAIEDVCQDRGLVPNNGFFKVEQSDSMIMVTAVEQVHDDIADRAFLRRYCRI